MKWYMNNPCRIIRVINDNFVEIEVYPKFAEDASGSDWCCACMGVAGAGAHPSHTCEPYQEVIDKINETDVAMIVVVESRLLQDYPVEFKPMLSMRQKTKDLAKKSDELRNDIYEHLKLLDSLKGELKDLVFQQSIEAQKLSSTKYDVMVSERKLERLKSKRRDVKQEIKEYQDYLVLKKKFEDGWTQLPPIPQPNIVTNGGWIDIKTNPPPIGDHDNPHFILGFVPHSCGGYCCVFYYNHELGAWQNNIDGGTDTPTAWANIPPTPQPEEATLRMF